MKYSIKIWIITAAALTLHCIPCDCRTFSTSNLLQQTNLTSNGYGNNTRSHRQTKGGIESNSIQRIVAQNEEAQIHKTQNLFAKSAKLKRVFLSNRDITCNDGSQAGFYLRKSPGSRKWVVFFEGGWYCYDNKSCKTRWTKMRHLMTSTTWTETRDVGGILSPISTENPYWFNANHVFVPYCSSDSWSGSRAKPDSRDSFRFMGSLIVQQVMADLIPLGLGHPQGADLIMAGSSAGGLGVMLNLDKVRTFLQDERGLNVHVRGVSDSGWFLDREPFTPGAIAASEVVRQGWKLWNGVLPEACAVEQTEPWRCYFGHRLYNTLKSPLFVFQWLFDEAQMRADSVAPVTPQQWDYIHEMGGALRASLNNVTAVFAPACIGHSVLTKRDWQNIKIDDISLTDSLRCWENSLTKERKIMLKHVDNKILNHNKKFNKKKNKQNDQPKPRTFEEREQRKKERRRQQRLKLSLEEIERKRLERHERRRQERLLQKMEAKNQTPRSQRSPQEMEISNKKSMPKIIENDPAVKQQQKRRRQHRRRLEKMEVRNTTRLPNHRRKNQQQKLQSSKSPNKRRHGEHNRQKLLKAQNQLIEIKEPKKCGLRLLERCSWPQCNHSCPTLTNPLTGEEMKFLELLTSFGLDIYAVAQALGVDMQTLNNMDHKELIKLFTESAS